jgi:Flp pilus assembly protein TadD
MLLAVLAVAALWPATQYGFFDMDDELYLSGNPAVREGLTGEGLRRAFLLDGYAANWHPLTWISLMLDVELFGVNAPAHHRVNILLHLVAALLLFALIHTAAGFLFPAFFIAALFAVHPARAESVVWIAERKDVLAAALGMLTLLLWWAYLRRPSAPGYLAAAASLGLGLMAKPMLVTIPLLLLLLDRWPLGRWLPSAGRPPWPLLVEKLPLLCLSLASSLLTMLAQTRGGLVAPAEALTPWWRLANALHGAAAYLRQTVWPADLAFWYPHQGRRLDPGELLLAAGILLALTLGALLSRRGAPWRAAGWLWYLILLLPVAGLVQVGTQGRADRYTYLPTVGLLFLAVAECARRAEGRLRVRRLAAAGGAAIVLLLALLLRRQTDFWRQSEDLYRRTLALTSRNWYIHQRLGHLLARQGRHGEAAAEFRASVGIRPWNVEAHLGLAESLERTGSPEEAVRLYGEILRGNPGVVEARYRLGNLLAQRGDLAGAEASYRRVLDLRPGDTYAHNNLATVLGSQGREEEAIRHYREAVRLDPSNAEAHNNLGVMLSRRGMAGEAEAAYRRALGARPAYLTAMANLADLLHGTGRTEEASALEREVARLDPGRPLPRRGVPPR